LKKNSPDTKNAELMIIDQWLKFMRFFFEIFLQFFYLYVLRGFAL